MYCKCLLILLLALTITASRVNAVPSAGHNKAVGFAAEGGTQAAVFPDLVASLDAAPVAENGGLNETSSAAGYWTGYWTWDSIKRAWFWTWVWIAPTAGSMAS